MEDDFSISLSSQFENNHIKEMIELKQYRAERENLIKNNHYFITQLSNLQVEFTELKAQLEAKDSENAKLRKKVKSLQDTRDSSEDIKEEPECSKQDLQQKLELYESAYKELLTERDHLKEEVVPKLQKSLNECKTENQNLKKQVESFQKQLENHCFETHDNPVAYLLPEVSSSQEMTETKPGILPAPRIKNRVTSPPMTPRTRPNFIKKNKSDTKNYVPSFLRKAKGKHLQYKVSGE